MYRFKCKRSVSPVNPFKSLAFYSLRSTMSIRIHQNPIFRLTNLFTYAFLLLARLKDIDEIFVYTWLKLLLAGSLKLRSIHDELPVSASPDPLLPSALQLQPNSSACTYKKKKAARVRNDVNTEISTSCTYVHYPSQTEQQYLLNEDLIFICLASD